MINVTSEKYFFVFISIYPPDSQENVRATVRATVKRLPKNSVTNNI